MKLLTPVGSLSLWGLKFKEFHHGNQFATRIKNNNIMHQLQYLYCILKAKNQSLDIIIYGLLMTTNIWTLNNTTLNEGDNSVKLVYLAMVTIHMEVFVHGHDPHCLLCTLSIKIKCQFSINQTNKSTHNKFSLFKDMPLSFPELCCVNPVKRFGSSAESCCGFFFFFK